MNKRKIWDWADPWTWVAAVMLVAIGVMLVIVFVPWELLGHKDAPAWVQAGGSLIAIGIAIAVPAWQHAASAKGSRKDKVEEFARVLQITLGMGRDALKHLKKLAEFDVSRELQEHAKFYEDHFQRTLVAMGQISLDRFPDSVSVQAFSGMQLHIDRIVAGLNRDKSGASFSASVVWRTNWIAFEADIDRLQWAYDHLFEPTLVLPTELTAE